MPWHMKYTAPPPHTHTPEVRKGEGEENHTYNNNKYFFWGLRTRSENKTAQT